MEVIYLRRSKVKERIETMFGGGGKRRVYGIEMFSRDVSWSNSTF